MKFPDLHAPKRRNAPKGAGVVCLAASVIISLFASTIEGITRSQAWTLSFHFNGSFDEASSSLHADPREPMLRLLRHVAAPKGARMHSCVLDVFKAVRFQVAADLQIEGAGVCT